MNNNRKSGSKAEEKAAKFLHKHHYRIIDRNYHAGRLGEIDIICESKSHLIFLEVKSSRFDDFGNPIYKIDSKKQKQIARIAEIFLSQYKTDKDCRFDVIVLIGDKLTHYIDAFRT